MRVAIYDRVEPPVPSELPFQLFETCSHRAAVAKLVLAVPLVLGVGFATLSLVFYTLFTPPARALVAQHPALGMEILAGIAFWTYLLGLPLKRLFDRLAVKRSIEIDAATVTVTESGHFRSWTWQAPLSSFAGVAHHVRASLSGTRHELILVHPTREKSVLLSLAHQMSQSEVDRVAALLHHHEIPPTELYRFKARLPRLTPPAWRDPAHA
jgi:hypothetical protein